MAKWCSYVLKYGPSLKISTQTATGWMKHGLSLPHPNSTYPFMQFYSEEASATYPIVSNGLFTLLSFGCLLELDSWVIS